MSTTTRANFEQLFQSTQEKLYQNSGEWKLLFESGHPLLMPLREEMYKIGDDAVSRCALCAVPQAGFQDDVSGLREKCGLPDLDKQVHELDSQSTQILLERKSKRNDNFCNCCDAYIAAHAGGADIELPVLVTDVRESTKVLRGCNPAQGAVLGLELRKQISSTAKGRGGFMLQDRGDGYMHVFPYGFAPSEVEDARQWALQNSVFTAVKLAKECEIPTPTQSTMRLGIGLHHGTTYMGAPDIDTLPNRLDLILVLGSATASIAAHLSDAAKKGTVVIAADTLERSGIDPEQYQWKVESLDHTEISAWMITP